MAPNAPAAEHRSSEAGNVSLLFGILSIPFAIVIFCGVIAIVCGIVGWVSTSKSKGFPKRSRTALAGIVLGVLSFGLIVLLKYDENQMINRARKVTALAVETALESAITTFFIEYGKLASSTSTELKTDSPEGIQLLTILLGLEKSDTPLNLRDIKFLAVKEGKNKRGGLIYDASGTPEGLFDPWGSPYTVELDTDNDQVLRFDLGGKPVELKGRRVAAYSPGADRKPGTSDDVTTW